MTQERVDQGYDAQIRSAAALLRRSLRSWRAGLVVLALGAVACVVFLLVRKPAFRSETVILYSEGVATGGDTERPEAGRSATTRLKEILLSRASLDMVGRQFGLYPSIRDARGPVDAAEELKKHIEFRAPGGDTFSLAFTGSSPSEARGVTARLAETLIAQDADLRRKQAISVRDFLEGERRTTADEMRDAERALASFMAAHPRFALDTTPFATGAAIRATMAPGTPGTPALAPARMWVETTRAAPPANAGPASVADTPRREALAEESSARLALDAAESNLAVLAARFTPAHPDVRAAQAEVERASTRLRAARQALSGAESHDPGPAASPQASAEAAPRHILVRRVASANPAHGSAAEPRASEHELVTLETEWVRLTRAATEARQHQDQVEAALFKASSAAQAQTGSGIQVTVIDPAFLPQSPVPPGRALIVALFAAGALLLASLAVLVKALLDERIYEAGDIEPLLHVLVAIPRRQDVSR